MFFSEIREIIKANIKVFNINQVVLSIFQFEFFESWVFLITGHFKHLL